MSVYQVTKLPVLSLPYGATNFPLKILDYIKDYERVYLWMDFDEMGQINLENFSNKIGKSRTYIVQAIQPNDIRLLTNKDEIPNIKDANDVLKFHPPLIWEYLKKAEA